MTECNLCPEAGCTGCPRTPPFRYARDRFEAPDLSEMSEMELVMLMGQCGKSCDPSDKAFAKACRDELARRKPEIRRQAGG